MAKASNKKATSPKSSSGKRTPKKTTMGRLKDAALSSEMLAAGIAASATAVATSPKARRALYEVGGDVAEVAGNATNQVLNNTAKFAALIGDAVADAVQRALSGDWLTEDAKSQSQRSASSKTAAKRVTSKRESPGKGEVKSKAPSARKSGATPPKARQGKRKPA